MEGEVAAVGVGEQSADGGGRLGTTRLRLGDTIDHFRDHASWIASFAAKFRSTATAIGPRSKDLLRLEEEKAEDMRKEVGRWRNEELEKAKEEEAKKRESTEIEASEEAFGLLGKKRVEVHPLDSSLHCTSLDHSSEASIRVPVIVNGKDLQIFLNEHSNGWDSVKSEVENALKLSSDPAKLVLDALEGFYPPHLKKGGLEFEQADVRKNCMMLLEWLTKFSPDIKPTIRKEAKELACKWRSRTSSDAQEVLALLQLLAAFDLASDFRADEIVNWLRIIAHYSKAAKLLRDLDFVDDILSVILKLLDEELRYEAAGLISAFGLQAEFASLTSSNKNQGSNAPSSLGNNSAACTIPTLMSSLNASPQSLTISSEHTHSGSDAYSEGCINSFPINSSDHGCNNHFPITEHPGMGQNGNVSSPSKILFVPHCLEVEGTDLKVLCEKIKINGLYCGEISDALELATDPAEFVLGVVKDPSSLNLKTEGKPVSLAFPEHGPLLLLSHIWRMPLRVKPNVEGEALSFAKDWKSKLTEQMKDDTEGVCFLLFLAAYKLVSYFDQDNLFSIFGKGYWSRYATKLFRILGFTGFIRKFLCYLLRNQMSFEALQCISEWGLLVNSPHANDFLNGYLNNCPEKLFSTGSTDRQFIDICREAHIWETVVGYTTDQNLAESLKSHILLLEKQKEELRAPDKWEPNAGNSAFKSYQPSQRAAAAAFSATPELSSLAVTQRHEGRGHKRAWMAVLPNEPQITTRSLEQPSQLTGDAFRRNVTATPELPSLAITQHHEGRGRKHARMAVLPNEPRITPRSLEQPSQFTGDAFRRLPTACHLNAPPNGFPSHPPPRSVRRNQTNPCYQKIPNECPGQRKVLQDMPKSNEKVIPVSSSSHKTRSKPTSTGPVRRRSGIDRRSRLLPLLQQSQGKPTPLMFRFSSTTTVHIDGTFTTTPTQELPPTFCHNILQYHNIWSFHVGESSSQPLHKATSNLDPKSLRHSRGKGKRHHTVR